MKLVKLCTVLSLAAVCMAFAPSQTEAREYVRCKRNAHVAVGISAGRGYCGPDYYAAQRVIVRRPAPVVERVYVQEDCCATREVVVVEQPYYEEVVVVPRPVYVPRSSFSFGLSFFR